jgi:hypothetical protein
MSKGIVFWRRDTDGENQHLRFVLSEPDVDDKVLIVHMTTFHGNGREDTSCILHQGDHDCVRHKSYIRYDQAFDEDMITFVRERTKGAIVVVADLEPSVLKRIQDGARVSRALPRKFRKHFAGF